MTAAVQADTKDRGPASIVLYGQARPGEQIAKAQAHRQVVAPGAMNEAHLRRLSARVILADCASLADAANLGPVSRAGA